EHPCSLIPNECAYSLTSSDVISVKRQSRSTRRSVYEQFQVLIGRPSADSRVRIVFTITRSSCTGKTSRDSSTAFPGPTTRIVDKSNIAEIPSQSFSLKSM